MKRMKERKQSIEKSNWVKFDQILNVKFSEEYQTADLNRWHSQLEGWNSNFRQTEVEVEKLHEKTKWLLRHIHQLIMWNVAKPVNPWSAWKYSTKYVLSNGTMI